MGVTLSPSAMKVLVLIICLGVVSANILKREAKSDPKAFGVGFGHGIGAIGYVRTSHHVPVTTTHHVATTHHVPVVKTHHVAETHHVSAAPRCKHTPMRECTPRRVEHPRKVCMTTTVTEEHTSTVVDESSQLIKSGEPKD